MKYEIGTQWKTRAGWRAVIVQWVDDGSFNAWHEGKSEVMHDDSGHCCEGNDYGSSDYDLIEPWKEPKKGRLWINIYDAFYNNASHENEEDAIKFRERGCLACVEVNFTEGEGLLKQNCSTNKRRCKKNWMPCRLR